MKTLSTLGSAGMTLFVSLGLGLAACSGAQLEPVTDDPVVDDVPKSVTSLVSATSVVSACPDSKHMNARAATNAINHLIEPCATVPGGKAHFSAKLLPGGKIELASPEGSAAEGVVPTCVLKGGLHHKVKLMHPCTFDVQLEERKIATGDPSH